MSATVVRFARIRFGGATEGAASAGAGSAGAGSTGAGSVGGGLHDTLPGIFQSGIFGLVLLEIL